MGANRAGKDVRWNTVARCKNMREASEMVHQKGGVSQVAMSSATQLAVRNPGGVKRKGGKALEKQLVVEQGAARLGDRPRAGK